MEITRKPFQGVGNIVRFNWHFYLFAGGAIMPLVLLQNQFSAGFQKVVLTGILLAAFSLLASLFVSFYIYDFSGFYRLQWLPGLSQKKVLNISAGFDETSELIKHRFSGISLTRCDFYDPQKHTEISIQRARKAYPPSPETLSVSTQNLPFSNAFFDAVLVTLSAHEIRNPAERIVFFRELKRITQPAGLVVVTEHLRDEANFLAFNLGSFHFYSRKSWLKTFREAGFRLVQEEKTTPFISTFTLAHNGIAS